MSYSIEWTKPALKELRALGKTTQTRIVKAVDKVLQGGCEMRKLTDRPDQWKLKAGDYRIIIKLDRFRKVFFVEHVKHRREAYRG